MTNTICNFLLHLAAFNQHVLIKSKKKMKSSLLHIRVNAKTCPTKLKLAKINNENKIHVTYLYCAVCVGGAPRTL